MPINSLALCMIVNIIWWPFSQGTHEHMDALHDNKSPVAFSGTPEPLSDIIHKICCEVVFDYLLLLNALDILLILDLFKDAFGINVRQLLTFTVINVW